MKRFKQFITESEEDNSKFGWGTDQLLDYTSNSGGGSGLFEGDEKWLGSDNLENHEQDHSDGEKIHPRQNLSHAKENSVNTYTNTGYKNINSYHRTGDIADQYYSASDPEEIKEISNDLDHVISNHKADHNIHLWRGIGREAVKKLRLNRGDIKHLTDKGYVSTSLSPDKALNFSKANGSTHVMHIKVTKGSNVLYPLKYKLGKKWEHEVILPRNAKFIHTGRTEHEGFNSDGDPTKFTIHHLEHIPEKE
jgi:hypothetical protein